MSETRYKMNEFFCGIQAKALKQIEFAIRDRDEALDILQDAMIRLAKKYSDKEKDWPRLFQRIIQNLIIDWYRRKKVRSIIVFWDKSSDDGEELEELGGVEEGDSAQVRQSPEQAHGNFQLGQKVARAIEQLPFRQQQAFTLRAWWGHNVEETAFAMGCSEGSVKTHYSRATNRLKQLLGDTEL